MQTCRLRKRWNTKEVWESLAQKGWEPPPPPRKPLLEDVLFVLTSELCSLNFAVVGFYAGVQTTLVGQSEPSSDKHHGEVYDMDRGIRKKEIALFIVIAVSDDWCGGGGDDSSWVLSHNVDSYHPPHPTLPSNGQIVDTSLNSARAFSVSDVTSDKPLPGDWGPK